MVKAPTPWLVAKVRVALLETPLETPVTPDRLRPLLELVVAVCIATRNPTALLMPIRFVCPFV